MTKTEKAAYARGRKFGVEAGKKAGYNMGFRDGESRGVADGRMKERSRVATLLNNATNRARLFAMDTGDYRYEQELATIKRLKFAIFEEGKK